MSRSFGGIQGYLDNWLTTHITLLTGNAVIFCLALIVKASFALQRQGASSITLHPRPLQSEVAELGILALSWLTAQNHFPIVTDIGQTVSCSEVFFLRDFE